MNVWIINPYGNIPGEGWRDYRSTSIADAFRAVGHQVTWWVSNFEHRSKKYRSKTYKEVKVNENYLVKVIPATPYKKHISFSRIKYERTYAKNVRRFALLSNEVPDLIIIGEPALFITDILMDIINDKKCPFLIDIIDLWPELFTIILPQMFIPLSRFIFRPLFQRRKRFFLKAAGIIGVSKDYLEIGLSENPSAVGEVVYWGIDIEAAKEANNIKPVRYKFDKYIKNKGETWVIYAGTLGNNYDIKSIINCAREIQDLNLPIKIFIAGDGALRGIVEESIRSTKLKSLIYLGKLTIHELNLFFKNCDLSLSSYVKNSTVSMPIKAYDSLAAGLPLINSLNRDLGSFVENEKVGIQYEPQDPKDMLRAIRYLSDNPECIAQMGVNARKLAKQFDSKVQYKKFVELADKVISS